MNVATVVLTLILTGVIQWIAPVAPRTFAAIIVCLRFPATTGNNRWQTLVQ
jgi:hypothetical protein